MVPDESALQNHPDMEVFKGAVMCRSTRKPLKSTSLDLVCSLQVDLPMGIADVKACSAFACLASVTRNIIFP